jgi:hypothetical protein
MRAPAVDSALLIAARQLADEALERSRQTPVRHRRAAGVTVSPPGR